MRLGGMEVGRLVDGRIVERWEHEDDQAKVDRVISGAMRAKA